MVKIVLDIKYTKDGSIARYKACFVVCSFTQIYRVYYKETFASTISYSALWIFFAITAKNNWKVHQVNIITAFLAGKLDEVFYLCILHFFKYFLRDYVQVLQSIYRLK